MKPAVLAVVACAVFASSVHAALVREIPAIPTPSSPSNPPYAPIYRPVHVNAAGDVVANVTFTRKPCASCPTQSIRRAFLVSGDVPVQLGIDEFQVVKNNDAGDIVGTWRDTWGTGYTYSYRVIGGAMEIVDSTAAAVTDLTEAGDLVYGGVMNDHQVRGAMMSDNEHGNHAFKFLDGIPAIDLQCSTPDPDFECVTGYNTGFDAIHGLNEGATVGATMLVGEDRDNPFSSSYGQQHAFVGYEGQTTYLSAGFTAAALAVNDLGVIVGYDDGQAIVWQPNATAGWDELTIASLANDPTWTFSSATSINNSGTIVGYGTHHGVPAMFEVSDWFTTGVAPGAGPGGALRFAVSPNPARGAVHFAGSGPAGARAARLTIVDLAGRRVAELTAPVANGSFEATWDGRDAQGTPLRAGVYFARLEAGARSGRATVVLTR